MEIRGPRGVRHDISAFLRAYFPIHLAACADAWGVELEAPEDAPTDPRKDGYYEREPVNLDRWPLVAVTSGRQSSVGAKDFSIDGDPEYRVTYPIRIYSWVKAEGFDACQDLRDDYGTALRITVLAHTNLGTAGGLVLIPSTVVTDFSDVAPVKGDRFVAGSYVGFNVTATETLTDRLALPGAQPRDTVSGVIAEGNPLPPAPLP